MNGTRDDSEPLTEDQELERDRRELRDSHEELAQIIARTQPAAERRREAMLKMQRRWGWDNARVAAELGVQKGTVWKAVRVKEAAGQGDQALAS